MGAAVVHLLRNRLCQAQPHVHPEHPEWVLLLAVLVAGGFDSCPASFSLACPDTARGVKSKPLVRDERQARPHATQYHPGRKGSLLGILLCQNGLLKVRIYGFHF